MEGKTSRSDPAAGPPGRHARVSLAGVRRAGTVLARPWFRATIAAVVVAIPVLLWTAAAYERHGRALQSATNDMRRVTATLSEQATRLLEAQGLVLDLVDQEAGGQDCMALRQDRHLQSFMQAIVAAATRTKALWVLDSQGFLCAASDAALLDWRSRAFRNYFSGARDAAGSAFYVNRAIVPMMGGEPVFNVARRRSGGPLFRGIVLAAIDLQGLAQEWRSMPVTAASHRVALFRADGATIARSWDPMVPPPDPAQEARLRAIWDHEPQGTRIIVPLSDGIARIVAWHTLPGWNVVVTSSMKLGEALAPWRQLMAYSGVVAGLASALLAAFIWSLARAQSRLEFANAGLERSVSQRTAALRASEERYRLTVESARDYAIVTLDEAGVITSWNVGAERMMGYSEAEAVGQPGAIFFTPQDRATGDPEDEMRRARREGRADNERWHLRRDGSRFWGSGLVMPLAGGLGYVKIFQDRTRDHEAGERLRLLGFVIEQSGDFIGTARPGATESTSIRPAGRWWAWREMPTSAT